MRWPSLGTVVAGEPHEDESGGVCIGYFGRGFYVGDEGRFGLYPRWPELPFGFLEICPIGGDTEPMVL